MTRKTLPGRHLYTSCDRGQYSHTQPTELHVVQQQLPNINHTTLHRLNFLLQFTVPYLISFPLPHHFQPHRDPATISYALNPQQ